MPDSTERPPDYPPHWPWPPVEHTDIPLPTLENVTNAVDRCLMAAHEIRIWAEAWPNRPNRRVPVTDHVSAIRDLMLALSIADPLLDACRTEFAQANSENPAIAGRLHPSFHVGAFWYAKRFPELAAAVLDSLLMITPPHPITGEPVIEILGISELMPEAYAAAVKELPMIDYADVAASITRESARAQASRKSDVPKSSATEAKPRRQRTTSEEAEASAKRLYRSLWKVGNKQEWGREIGADLNRRSVDPRTIEKLPSWKKAELKRNRSAEIGQRLRAHGLTGEMRDQLQDATAGNIDSLIQNMDDADRELLKADEKLQELWSEQQKDDAQDHQYPDA